MKKNKLPKKFLENLYLDKKLSIKEISIKLNCSYWKVWKALKDYRIQSRSLSEANTLNNLKRKIQISKTKLQELYVKQGLSSLQIAKLFKCHHKTIFKRLKEHNIKTRDKVDANTKYLKTDFDGTPELKAYMLGFALGDLNVRKPNKKGKTIVIHGVSTVPEQIDLINHLFKKYGPVKINDFRSFSDDGKRAIIHLNESFNFLLFKQDKIPSWALKKEELFFAFLAGYTDAEGHIRTQKPTWFSINTYDKGILTDIHKKLNEYDINCKKPRISAKKGYISLKKTKPYNKDMWQIGVYSKKSLLQLFSKLKPHLRHENKIKAMIKSLKQINMRNEKYGYQRM